MSNRAVILTIILFVLIVGGMFSFAYLKKQEVVSEQLVTEEPEPEVKYADISRIDAKHYFADGVHTLVGEIPMPTPCDLLNYQVMVAESYPEQVTVDFTVINNAEFCAEVITPARFKVEFQASEEASISARFMDRSVELNLIPAEPGESPDNFEVFIKG